MFLITLNKFVLPLIIWDHSQDIFHIEDHRSKKAHTLLYIEHTKYDEI